MSEEKLDRILGKLDAQSTTLSDHGELLATIDERTKQHASRMNAADRRVDRIERRVDNKKTIGIAAGGGVTVVALVESIKHLFGFGAQ